MRRLARLLLLAAVTSGCRLGTEARVPDTRAPRLIVTPESLAFHGRLGATLLPDQYISIGLDTVVSARWHAYVSANWFLLAATGDTVPFFLHVGGRPAGLAPGSYSASISIVVPTDSLRIPVTLQLDSAASLTGRWAASQDSARIILDLTDSNGSVAGTGSIAPPASPASVTGTRSDTTVALTLTAGGATYSFSGLLVGDTTLVGTLTGGTAGLALTFYRQ